MLSEFRKSINAVLYERLVSPLFGSFLFSWIIWNWKIVMYLIFGNNISLAERIDCIENELWNWDTGFLNPIYSTLVLIVVYPFLALGAYWIWVKFRRWKTSIKYKNELLTIEKSNRIMRESDELEKRMAGIIQSKDEIIEQRDNKIKQINVALKEISSRRTEEHKSRHEGTTISEEPISKWKNEYEVLKSKNDLFASFAIVVKIIATDRQLKDELGGHEISYFSSNDIIEKNTPGYYSLTPKGNFFKDLYVKDKYG